MSDATSPSAGRPRRWNGSPTFPLLFAVGAGVSVGLVYAGAASWPLGEAVWGTVIGGTCWLLFQLVALVQTRLRDLGWALFALRSSYAFGIVGLVSLLVVIASALARALH